MISFGKPRSLVANDPSALNGLPRPQISRGKSLFVWMGLLATVVAIVGTLVVASFLWNGRTRTISGRVVSRETGEPLAGALVALESSLPYAWETEGLGQYVKTDSNGRFSASVRGLVSIRIWKPDYAMAEEGISASGLSSKENVMELRHLTSIHPIQETISKDGLIVGEGFSFAYGRVVAGDDSNADFRLIKDPRNGSIWIEALRTGGLSYQEYGKGVDFYNTPEAPASDYSARLPVISGSMGVFYVLTGDGKHYAKVRLIRGGVKQTSHGADYSGYWLESAYQPDGSRSLEIAMGREYGFPFESFSIDRQSPK